METEALMKILALGEDSRHQFKSDMRNVSSLSSEMVAFANSQGGFILIGVRDDGSLSGLTSADVSRLNQIVSNAASEGVVPPIAPTTTNLALPDGMVVVVTVEAGMNKPYMDKQGAVWTKAGADKRRVTAREELQRMFQDAALVHADEVPVKGTSVADVDLDFFEAFFERIYGERLADQEFPLAKLLAHMNLMSQGQLNIGGALLFAKKPHLRLPVFIIRAVALPGTDIADDVYNDSQELTGKIADVFQKALGFVLSNIHHQQNDQGFNSIGEPEIPRIVFEELIANALIHRDYFISAPVRLLVFADRVEIISPGHLPNHLTVENIKLGNSNTRNPILASFATKILPYRGLGSGILRALKAYPHIEFVNDVQGNLFKVSIQRQAKP